jgi:hypothetical protein
MDADARYRVLPLRCAPPGAIGQHQPYFPDSLEGSPRKKNPWKDRYEDYEGEAVKCATRLDCGKATALGVRRGR